MPRVMQAIYVPVGGEATAHSGTYANPDNTVPMPLCDFDDNMHSIKEMFGLIEPKAIMRIPSHSGIEMVVVQEEFSTPNMAHRNERAEMILHGYTAAADPIPPVMPSPKPIRGDVVVLFVVPSLHFIQ